MRTSWAHLFITVLRVINIGGALPFPLLSSVNDSGLSGPTTVVGWSKSCAGISIGPRRWIGARFGNSMAIQGMQLIRNVKSLVLSLCPHFSIRTGARYHFILSIFSLSSFRLTRPLGLSFVILMSLRLLTTCTSLNVGLTYFTYVIFAHLHRACNVITHHLSFLLLYRGVAGVF